MLGVLLSQGDEATTAVSTALRGGYQLIDTAAAYFNAREVKRGIKESGVVRANVFLTTRLWMTDYRFDAEPTPHITAAARTKTGDKAPRINVTRFRLPVGVSWVRVYPQTP